MTITVSAPGKLFFAGEHAVVYGYPALVAAVSQRLDITYQSSIAPNWSENELLNQQNLKQVWRYLQSNLNGGSLTISSQLPIGSGLGSSAAMSTGVSLIWHLVQQQIPQDQINLGQVNELAYELEKLQHGNPSGVDNSVATYGGFVWYRKENEKLKLIEPLNQASFSRALPPLFLLDSGSPAENTGQMVAAVAALKNSKPDLVKAANQSIERVAQGWLRWLFDQENLDVADLIKQNQAALTKLQVVSPRGLEIIAKIEQAGGAAKICGAGGKTTGSGMLLVYHEDHEKLLSLTEAQNWNLQPVELGGEGVRVE